MQRSLELKTAPNSSLAKWRLHWLNPTLVRASSVGGHVQEAHTSQGKWKREHGR
ncbi:MAG: hypothetical protein H6607_06560 [Flavobacteriales bacterium]|nr:hypothetical protein [Flavobacteriales bacterium]